MQEQVQQASLPGPSEAQQIALEYEDALENIEFGKAIDRLESNPDFIKVIKAGYCDEYLVSAVRNKAHTAMADKQEVFDRAITGVGNLMAFLDLARVTARRSAESLHEHEEALEEARNEDV